MTGFPADTSAVLRMLYNPDVLAQWHDLLTSGVVSMCPITELEFLYTVRSKADRERQKTSAGDVPLGRHAGPVFEQAAQVQAPSRRAVRTAQRAC